MARPSWWARPASGRSGHDLGADGSAILVGTTGGLLAVPAAGDRREVRPGPIPAAGDLYFIQPQASGRRQHRAVRHSACRGLSRTLLGVLSLKTGAVTRVELAIIHPLGVIDGTLVYVSPAGALTAVRFDARRGGSLPPRSAGPERDDDRRRRE